MSFHLRPVKDGSPSPSTTATASPTEERKSRRPLSPSSLRDVDLTHSPDTHARKYPAPPTGHDLMAMFPPRAPTSLGNRTESTSRYFQPQERSFFAQPGKEIVRIHVDIEDVGKPRHWPVPTPQTTNPTRQSPRHAQRLPVFPPMPPHPGPVPTQAQSQTQQQQQKEAEDYREQAADDDAWRTPMPFHERRRAGKHTRRVIVKT